MTKGSSSFHIKKKKNGGNSTPACLALLQPSPPPPAPSLPVNSHNLSPSPLLESSLHHLVKLPLSVVLMGSAISGLADEAKGCSVPPSRTCLGDLPGGCITSILKFLDPLEICRFACLNRAFRDASSADVVWESKLPPNYRFLVERVLGEDPRRMGKREIFSRLCRPNCFDGGTKEALLDKITGSICVAVSSTALKITGIEDRRYWNRIPSEESRFGTVAYLQQMWWIEVVGEFEFQLCPGTYSFYFRLQLGKTAKRFCRRTCDLNQVHGWDIKPVRFQLSTSNGQSIVSERFLDKPGDWVQYHVGDFDVENQDSPIGIKFSMVQIDCTHTKGGLCVDCVLICPRENWRRFVYQRQ